MTKEEVKHLIKSLMGIETTDERAQKILDTLNGFNAFLESGKPFKEVSDNSVGTVAVFQEEVVARGGSLVRNEIWILLAFMSWSGNSRVLYGDEADAYQELRDAVAEQLTHSRVVKVDDSVKPKLQALLKAVAKGIK